MKHRYTCRAFALVALSLVAACAAKPPPLEGVICETDTSYTAFAHDLQSDRASALKASQP